MFQYSYNTVIGKIYIAEENNEITNISFKKVAADEKETPLIKKAFKELEEYFEKKRKTFDLPIAPKGTIFQRKVWDELLKIPYGETVTYKYIARKIGNEKACRAVGMSNNKNPIAIIIPCHRVIGINGNLTGYAGGINLKKKLIELENN